MNLRFRPAAMADAAAVVPLMHSAGPDAYAYLFGDHPGGPQVVIRALFEADVGFWGLSNVVVATIDDRVVATGGFYSGEEYGSLALSAIFGLPRVFGPWRGFRMLARLRRFGGHVPPPAPEMHFVQDFGVHPDLRGRGVGSALLLSQAEEARQRGKTRFGLDVATNNPNAQRLYERLGFVFTAEHSPKGRLKSRLPGARRMVLNLT